MTILQVRTTSRSYKTKQKHRTHFTEEVDNETQCGVDSSFALQKFLHPRAPKIRIILQNVFSSTKLGGSHFTRVL